MVVTESSSSSSSSIMKNIYTKEHEEALKAQIELKLEQYKDYYYGASNSSNNNDVVVVLPDDIRHLVVLHYLKSFFGRGINELNDDGMTPIVEAIKGYNEDWVSMIMLIEYYPLYVTGTNNNQGNDSNNDNDNNNNNDWYNDWYSKNSSNDNNRNSNKSNILDINTKDRFGSTALHHAVTALHHAKHPGLIEYLIENNANVNAVNKYGMTPLHYATSYPCPKPMEVFTCLIESCNADLNRMDLAGRSPLFAAFSLYLGVAVGIIVNFCSRDPDSLNKEKCLRNKEKYRSIISYLLEEKKGVINNRFYMLHHPDLTDEQHGDGDGGEGGGGGGYFVLCANWNEYIHHNGTTVIAMIIGGTLSGAYKLVPVDTDTSSNDMQCFLPIIIGGKKRTWRLHS